MKKEYSPVFSITVALIALGALYELYRAFERVGAEHPGGEHRVEQEGAVDLTGAHPDDEHNGMMATLRHQHGARIVIADIDEFEIHFQRA